ncbi:MAG TPA: hypothetical protein VH478_00360 [Trebonia sp.]|jgi:hypothetical protein|nr:hypothetical protein [Trebonia sp.]
MRLTFIGKDPRSNPTGSPTVYATGDRTLLIQGWELTDERARATMRIPAGEDAVEIPVRMVPYIVRGLLEVYEQAAGPDSVKRIEESSGRDASPDGGPAGIAA